MARRRVPIGWVLAASFLLSGWAHAQALAPASEAPRGTPTRTFRLTASKYHFTPDRITVKRGVVLVLVFNSEDVTHCIHLPGAPSKDIAPGIPTVVQAYAKEPGTARFSCSHLCGLGHWFMRGTITVE